LFSIVGGKLTTYRSLAEQTVDLVLKKLGRDSLACTTDSEPLPGASEVGSVRRPTSRGGDRIPIKQTTTNDFDAFCAEFKRSSDLPEATSDRLLRIHGTRSSLIIDLVNEDASLAEVFDPETGTIAAEVVMAFKHELAQTLADCLLRRTMVGLNSSCGLNAVEPVARIAQKFLGWSDSRAAEEIAAYREEVRRRFRG
jgi:glycerol-3-phosphate dehydrogenase